MSKYDSEIAERLDQVDADDDIGSVDELGNYRRYDAELTILHATTIGFVDSFEYDSLAELEKVWDSILQSQHGCDNIVLYGECEDGCELGDEGNY